MKANFKFALVLISLPLLANASQVLVEAWQTVDLVIPKGQRCDTAIVELSFTVDTGCFVLFTTGAMARMGNFWVKLDGNKLRPKIPCTGKEMSPVPISYASKLESGHHKVTLWFECYYSDLVPIDPSCTYAYLQALLFLPDSTVTKGIEEENDQNGGFRENPVVSLVTKGPYVQVPGCIDLVDDSGRIIENAVIGDKVMISNLSRGTYYARGTGGTTVKVVKVQ